MLPQQRNIFNKEGFGYNMNSRKNILKKFVKASNIIHPSISCNYYGKDGHISHPCLARRSNRKNNNWKSKNLRPRLDPRIGIEIGQNMELGWPYSEYSVWFKDGKQKGKSASLAGGSDSCV